MLKSDIKIQVVHLLIRIVCALKINIFQINIKH
jgi:hypothetical protein